MTSGPLFRPSDWDGIRLVVFDMDGTLYDQRPLRVRMMRDVLRYALAQRTFATVSVLRAYRRIRERLAAEEVPDFERALLAETAKVTGYSPDHVRLIVEEWMERRPLPYLLACRSPRVVELFAALRRNGKAIAILSDYPARAKLSALGLDADYAVCANDPDIGLLKPHPRGLEAIIASAGTTARQTVLIGDRADRDGEAARRAGAWPLIKSAKPIKDWQTFAAFDDPIFGSLMRS